MAQRLTKEAAERLSKSRNVLYDPKSQENDFVSTFSSWAKYYDQDINALGGQVLRYLSERVVKYAVNKQIRILDMCGGTGMLGEKLADFGYEQLEISDGCQEMLKEAEKKGVYGKFYCEIVERNRKMQFLRKNIENDHLYDFIIMSECLCEYRKVVEQVVNEALKPGGYMIIYESVPHATDKELNLDGIGYVEKLAKIDASPIELVEKRTDLIYDLYNKENAYLLVIKKKF